jgi:Mrp family chromosome partitioning ATPase
MKEECHNNCSSCAENCSERTHEKTDLREKLNQMSQVKKVIAVVSGKGGVGKSLVTSMLAVLMNRAGLKTAIMDADVTGPSIPQAFGLHEKAEASDLGIYPVKTKTGIEVISLNLLLDHETDPVIWRGPIVAGMIKQFWTDVVWGEVDYMFVDMPPGTGDVPLTVFQSLPVDGIIVVTSPQQLVGIIVEKAVNMAKMMNIPVLGLVENMSYFKCPECGSEHHIFGESKLEETAEKLAIKTIARIPINPKLTAATDAGCIELFEENYLDGMIDMLLREEGK